MNFNSPSIYNGSRRKYNPVKRANNKYNLDNSTLIKWEAAGAKLKQMKRFPKTFQPVTIKIMRQMDYGEKNLKTGSGANSLLALR